MEDIEDRLETAEPSYSIGSADCSVKVAINIRPLINDEIEAERGCLNVLPGGKEVRRVKFSSILIVRRFLL